MTRRGLWSALLVDIFGAKNFPKCPVCRTTVEENHPKLYDVVSNSPNNLDLAVIPDSTWLLCQKCGIKFSAKAEV